MKLRVFVALVLLILASPFVLQAGFGLYYGLDVGNGISWLVRHYAGMDTRIYRAGLPLVSDPPRIDRWTVTWAGDIADESLSEASGLAASRTNPGVLYSVNDSGNEPRLFALAADGGNLGSWRIDYPGMHDFEDLAAFRWQDRNYLLVADTGDNFYWRRSLRLVVVPEPHRDRDLLGTTLVPEWIVEFSFPGGARDVGAVAVDPESEHIWLVSKRHVPAELFTLPLRPDGPVTAVPAGDLLLPQPTARDQREDPQYWFSRSMPTAMDMQGRLAVVQTYQDAYIYQRQRNRSWQDAFREPPVRVPLPYLNGLESAAFTENGKALVVTGERSDGVQRMALFRAER